MSGFYVHPTSIIDQPCEIGAGTTIWHFCHVSSGCRIGPRCSFGQNCFVAPGVIVGQNCKIQNNVSLYQGVILEDDVFCGPSMVFTNVINPRSAINRKDEYRVTRVGRGTTIGANATLVCGNDVGCYAFVAAGAVITHPVTDYALMAGVPARQVGWMSAGGHRLELDGNGRAVCPTTKEEYWLVEGLMRRVG
jgi:UDP-2-acetamido-3-amino-2,3-dideoxy-glucuronate N-acetyltransferase